MSIELRAKFQREQGFALDVDVTIADNEVTALYGASGSGKTTMLRLITGLERADNVAVRFRGEAWQTADQFIPTHQRHIGYVFQHLNLFPHLTADQNLVFAESRRTTDAGLSRSDLTQILDLDTLLDKRPDQLSGGEQQRVAIARALLSAPNLLVMDEPLGSIDAMARTRILPYLQRLHDSLSIPVIYVSHSLDEVLEIADTVLTIDSGKVIAQCPVTEFAIDGTGAETADGAALIRCVVSADVAEHDLATVNFENQLMYIAAQHYTAGDVIRVKIPARDVSLTRDRPTTTSILNIIETTIERIMDPGHGPTATVKLGCGDQYLLARITRKSVSEMDLKPGETIFAQIKGVALITDHERS